MNKNKIFAGGGYTAPELDVILVNAEFGVDVSSEYSDIENTPSYDYGDF